MIKEKIQFLIDNIDKPILVIDTLSVGELNVQKNNVTIFRTSSPKDILRLLAKVENVAVIIDGWYMQFHDEVERKWFRDSLRKLAEKNKLIIV